MPYDLRVWLLADGFAYDFADDPRMAPRIAFLMQNIAFIISNF